MPGIWEIPGIEWEVVLSLWEMVFESQMEKAGALGEARPFFGLLCTLGLASCRCATRTSVFMIPG